MMAILDQAGYKLPTSPAEFTTISKAKAVDALGQVTIQQLGAEGDIIEEWVLVNAWVKDVKFGELDYTSDEMVDVEIELRYDFAHLNNDERKKAVPAGGTNKVVGGSFPGTTS